MAGSSSSSSDVLCRIKRKIDKKKKMYRSKIMNKRKNRVDIDDIDAKMNTLVLLEHNKQSWTSSSWDKDAADFLLLLNKDIDAFAHEFSEEIDAFAQDLGDMLLEYNNATTTTSSSTSNGDEDLSRQQQQQLFLSSLVLQFGDPLEIDAIIQS